MRVSRPMPRRVVHFRADRSQTTAISLMKGSSSPGTVGRVLDQLEDSTLVTTNGISASGAARRSPLSSADSASERDDDASCF